MRLEALHPQWPALNRLLDEALELVPAERSAWLEALAGGDAALRPTLARLLQLHGEIETGDFLRQRPPLPEPGPQSGETVGPYRLQRRLGRGGMGTVWLAERADGGLKRPVALKLPLLTWDEGVAARMARERDILAALDHPHIARLHDAGFDTLGRPWLALEFVEGHPIDRHARERGLDVRARVQLLLQAAQAVAYAHGRQVVHRDLKPSNMLVGADGHLRLLDFGIARLLQGGVADTALTRVGDRALTIAYASPEQVRGDAAGPASDVWSLGVVAYELLAGVRPYRLERGSAAELEEAITGADIEAPSRRAADAATARALAGNLDAIVLRALRRDPATRTPSAAALAADLQRHLAGEPVQARPEGWHERGLRWLRRRRVAFGVAVGVAAALVIAVGLGPAALAFAALAAGLVLASVQARQARRQAAQAEAQTRRADAVQQLLFSMLESAGIGAGSAEERRQLTIAAWLEHAAQQLRAQPLADAALHESMLQLVSRLQHGLGACDAAAALREEWVRRLAARGAAPADRARACRAWGESLAGGERNEAACAAFEQGLALLATGPAAVPAGAPADGPVALEAALLRGQLGLLRLRQGRLDMAAELLEPVLEQLPGGSEADRADLLGAVAALRTQQGRFEEAASSYRQAIAADIAAGDTLRPAAIDRRLELAQLFAAQGHYGSALATCEAALEAVEAAGGADHPATVQLREDRGRMLSIVGRTAEAALQLQLAAAAVARSPAAFPALAGPRLQLRQAEMLIDEGRIAAAGAPLLAAVERMRGAPVLEACHTLLLHARWFTETGRFDEALRCLDEAHTRRVAGFGEQHAYTLSVVNRMVVVHSAAGNWPAAQVLIDRILAVPIGDGQPVFGTPQDLAASNRVQLLIEQGRFAEALAPAQDSLARLLAPAARQAAAPTEISLRLRRARALLGCAQLDEAREHLQAIDGLAQPLFEHAPQRATIDAAWAEAQLAAGDVTGARARLAQARGHLAAQPEIGPQFRRYPDRVAELIERRTGRG